MSTKPRAITKLPTEWTWYMHEPTYAQALLPFNPTPLEFWWAYTGDIHKAEEQVVLYETVHHGSRIIKRRLKEDPQAGSSRSYTEMVTAYALIRHKHPLKPLPKQDYSIEHVTV